MTGRADCLKLGPRPWCPPPFPPGFRPVHLRFIEHLLCAGHYFHALAYLSLQRSLLCRVYDAHFSDGKTEAQKSNNWSGITQLRNQAGCRPGLCSESLAHAVSEHGEAHDVVCRGIGQSLGCCIGKPCDTVCLHAVGGRALLCLGGRPLAGTQ